MASIKNIVTALVISVTGWLFAYFSYPFFNSLLTAISDTTGIFDGWTTINNIMWAGYILIIVLWVLVIPAWTMFTTEAPVA